jgi:hypothetical protein
LSSEPSELPGAPLYITTERSTRRRITTASLAGLEAPLNDAG